MMLDCSGNDVPSVLLQSQRRAHDRSVVGFRAAAGEHHVPGPRIEHAGASLARLIYGPACVLRQRVDAGRIAVLLSEKGPHRFRNLGRHGRGCRVVHVDGMTWIHHHERSPDARIVSLLSSILASCPSMA